LKLAFVVQRYGADIAGGSEAHCRQLATRLAPHHDITVLTTCARDYVTWENASPAGAREEEGVHVIRFPVERPRRRAEFAELTDEVIDGATPEREIAWFHENGPIVPALLDHLRQHGASYELVLFWTFRYYPSFFGLPLVADRAILVPTAEEDPMVALSVLRTFFRRPAGYLFMTPEEEALVSAQAGAPLPASAIVGIGLEPVVIARTGAGGRTVSSRARALLDAHGVPSEFLLYLGRVDRNKGCETLLGYFQEYAAQTPEVSLVLAGPEISGEDPLHATALQRIEFLEAVYVVGGEFAVDPDLHGIQAKRVLRRQRYEHGNLSVRRKQQAFFQLVQVRCNAQYVRLDHLNLLIEASHLLLRCALGPAGNRPAAHRKRDDNDR